MMIPVALCLGPLLSASHAATPRTTADRVDRRTQYPAFLTHSYFAVSLGSIHYGFSRRQLQAGFQAAAVEVPHPAARVTLFGHEFNRFLSAQVTYMRPVLYVSYRNVNGDRKAHRLLVHFGGLTLKPQLPVGRRLSLYGEAGLGLTSRRAIEIGGVPVVTAASYASVLLGAGAEYHLGSSWDLAGGATWSPGSDRYVEPRTLLFSGGFRYNLRPLPVERVEANRSSDVVFPKSVLQIEYTTGVGYGVNDFVSKKVPIFWGGAVKVARGVAVHLERNVFHTRKRFAFDLGASASFWKSRGDGEEFVSLSGYPLFRLTLVHTKPADLHLFYSLAGPSWVSKSVIDGRDTGGGFTFQDFMGVGAFLGKGRRVSAALKINHYSNGNLLTDNAGIKVPLTLGLGLTF
jgi:opacity protein-like surface antigen